MSCFLLFSLTAYAACDTLTLRKNKSDIKPIDMIKEVFHVPEKRLYRGI